MNKYSKKLISSITLVMYSLILRGIYSAEDTGGNIKGDKIDILFATKQEAFNFGVRHDVVVKIAE